MWPFSLQEIHTDNPDIEILSNSAPFAPWSRSHTSPTYTSSLCHCNSWGGDLKYTASICNSISLPWNPVRTMSLAADLSKGITMMRPPSTKNVEGWPPGVSFPKKYRDNSLVNSDSALVQHNFVKCWRKCTNSQQPLRSLPNVDSLCPLTSHSKPRNYSSSLPLMKRLVSSSRRDGHCTQVSSVEMTATAESSEVMAVWDAKQGLREEMEDELVVVQDVPGGYVYAGVFDGHSGHVASRFLRYSQFQRATRLAFVRYTRIQTKGMVTQGNADSAGLRLSTSKSYHHRSMRR